MQSWWEGLSAFEKVYFIVACVATVILIVQVILLLVGMHDGGMDFDGDADIDADGDGGDGISIFTIKGLVSFFAVGCWVGLILSTSGAKLWVSVLVSVAAGAAALVGVGFALRAMYKLASSGNLDYKNAVGKIANVYVTVPPNMSGRGKITLMLQGKYAEIDAMTREEEAIPTDLPVEIAEEMGDVLVVRRIPAKDGAAPAPEEGDGGKSEKTDPEAADGTSDRAE